MQRTKYLRIFAIALAGLFAIAAFTIQANSQQTGQRFYGQVTVEPAVNDSDGSVVYLLTPNDAPFPSNADAAATAPLYLVVYPLSSTIPADQLNCQPTNCDHANVLPFPNSDYGALTGKDKACTDFNGGNACSSVKGHDHLVGIAPTQGDFNVAWSVKLVFFTPAGFSSGKINERVTTLEQLTALWKAGDVMVAPTPILFNCSSTSERTYEIGTEKVIAYP